MDDSCPADLVIFLLICVDKIDNGGRFARSRGTVKEEIGEVVFIDNVLEYGSVFGVENNICEIGGAVFFNPWNTVDIVFIFCHIELLFDTFLYAFLYAFFFGLFTPELWS
jgi:hypothetical protein